MIGKMSEIQDEDKATHHTHTVIKFWELKGDGLGKGW
jgi:hypothetical protein